MPEMNYENPDDQKIVVKVFSTDIYLLSEFLHS